MIDVGVWVGAFWQGVVFLVVLYAVSSIAWGAALSRWARYPLWLGIVLALVAPVLGPVVAAIIVVARRPAGGRTARRPMVRRWESLLLTLPLAALAAALVVPWWRLQVTGSPELLLYPSGHFLDVLLIGTAVIYVVAVVLFVAGDLAHLSALLLVGPVVSWACFLWLVFALTDATERTLGGVAAMTFTVGDVLSMTGLDPGSLVIPGVTDADVTDLAGEIHVRVGDGWYAIAIAVVLTAIWILRQAFRRLPPPTDRAAASARSSRGAPPSLSSHPMSVPQPPGPGLADDGGRRLPPSDPPSVWPPFPPGGR